MNLLLDTHIALWTIADAQKLPGRAQDLIVDLRNTVCISAVTLWEIAIKHALSQRRVGRMPVSAGAALGHFRSAGFEVLDVSAQHVLALEALPMLHADPFDRMLVAQALSEPMRLLTSDAAVAAYDDKIIRV